MLLKEAIETLDVEKRGLDPAHHPRLTKALGLGIEALKLNKEMRETLRWPLTMVLPGETEEQLTFQREWTCLTNKVDLTDMLNKYSKLRVSGLKFREKLREVQYENSA